MRCGFLSPLPALAFALLAAQATAGEPEKPVTDNSVNAVDVATTPVTDLNLKRDEIPQLLIEAQENPYDLTGLGHCGPLVAEVEKLNTMLGDDVDLQSTAGKGGSAGHIAQSLVGSVVPFRGLVREISGANEQKRKLQAAIEAGIARRSFLKGVGQTRGCRYPARPASAEEIAAHEAALKQPDSNQPEPGQDRKSK